MADNLDDGEFWLPSQFLTDDDILEDFKSEGFTSGFGFGSSSDLGSLSTENETSDDDDQVLSGFRTKAPMPMPMPMPMPSGSPQSTLYGWEYTRQGSSEGSPTGPVSTQVKPESEETLDLLNKAAGEVAKMKMRSERSTGTGFFDCSNSGKGLLCPPSPQTQTKSLPQRPLPVFQPPFYSYPHFRFPPHMMYGAVQLPPPQQRQIQIQNRVTKNNATNSKTNSKTNNVANNRPLGLPPSAWPPLPGQAQPQTPQPQPKAQPLHQQPKAQPMTMYAVPQGVSVGTGVFLPRVVTATPEAKKKSDGNVTKTKNNNKGSQRRNARPTKANDIEEIQLPSEWVY